MSYRVKLTLLLLAWVAFMCAAYISDTESDKAREEQCND